MPGRSAAPPLITVTLNGEPRQVPAGLTVAALLEHLGIQASRVAVERNGAVVQRAHHGETLVEAGDTLEVVRFVGGG